MGTRKEEKDALARDMLGRMADKWTLSVIDVLEQGGTLRFSRILDGLAGVSQKMLTKTLRQMERDGLVLRQVYAEVPPRVEYKLTPLGESLAEAACGIWLWVEKHFDDVGRARKTFERKHATSADRPGSR
jgi:DNA-binding HxlR family transcriptional regulator